MYATTTPQYIMKQRLISPSLSACFHQGRTDQNGGHHDWLNREGKGFGVYHYHHKQPAHFHPNGECPYGALKVSIINPYTGKKIDLGAPYYYYDYPYFSLNLAAKALTARDSAGVELSVNNTGGVIFTPVPPETQLCPRSANNSLFRIRHF